MPHTQTQTPPAKKRLPYHGPGPFPECYACDDTVIIGFRDRRPEGGMLELACKRHADPTIEIFHACQFCDGPVGDGSLDIDGTFAHKKCYEAEAEERLVDGVIVPP
jgi:hypothetical protein